MQPWRIRFRVLGVPLTTAQSEVGRLAGEVGRSRVVRANLSSPSVPPLTQLTLVTFGLQTAVGEQFAGHITTRSARDGGELANRSALRRVPWTGERPEIEATACGFAA